MTVVSMSWGSSEFQGESSYNSIFTTAAGHANVTYVAASGDSAAFSGPEYPSVSPNVLAVGGTTLSLTSSGTYSSESGWTDSTGGLSGTDSNFRFYESEPSYQTSTLTSAGLSVGVRTTPDVSFNADPDSGVSVYDSVGYGGQSGWFDLGGTSAAAPAWAGLIAITDQGLATGGKGSLTTTQVLTDLYSLPSSDFNDITTGSNGYSATTGYDLVTGLGTPKPNEVIAGLLASNGVSENTTTTAATTTTSSSQSTTTVAASPHKVQAKHAKVVVKKIRKVARKADLESGTTAVLEVAVDSTIRSLVSSASTSSTTSTTSSSASLISQAVSQSSGQSLAALTNGVTTAASSTSAIPQVRSTELATAALTPVNQRMEVDRGDSEDRDLALESQPSALRQSVFHVQLVSNDKERNTMTRPAFVMYEPALAQAPAFVVRALLNPADNEFDDALDQVASTVLSRRPKPQSRRRTDGECQPEPHHAIGRREPGCDGSNRGSRLSFCAPATRRFQSPLFVVLAIP